MLDVAIVGGGLSGLALARSCVQRGQTFQLFEVSERLGGRVLTKTASSGLAIELGAAWFWPESQPLLRGLIADFGLAHHPQFEDGDILELADAEAAPKRRRDPHLHRGARRLEGGFTDLIRALAADAPAGAVKTGHALVAVRDAGDHVQLSFSVGPRTIECESRHVVLATPPRLIAQDVRFSPMLEDETRDALAGEPTWMAGQAKAVLGYANAFWRRAGQSGAAFVTHEQAVLSEVYDACDGQGRAAALGGLLALSPAQRHDFSAGLPMLLTSQIVQLFGDAGQDPELHYRDWALEPRICSARDREAPAAQRHEVGHPLLRRALWGGKLHFGGSETAPRAAGLLEGALEAAQRVDREIVAQASRASPRRARASAAAGRNEASLVVFAAWVGTETENVFDDYRRRLNLALAGEERDQLTQRALLGAMEHALARALGELRGLPFEASGVQVDNGRCSLTPRVQEPFRGLMRCAVDDVWAFNRTSCALSNFPHEHRPSSEYRDVILRDIAAAWREFSLAANRLLLDKTGAQPVGATS